MGIDGDEPVLEKGCVPELKLHGGAHTANSQREEKAG
jgi:hypothetical protein